MNCGTGPEEAEDGDWLRRGEWPRAFGEGFCDADLPKSRILDCGVLSDFVSFGCGDGAKFCDGDWGCFLGFASQTAGSCRDGEELHRVIGFGLLSRIKLHPI